MTLRRPLLGLIVLLLGGPVVWAALNHIRQEQLFDLVRDAARAHERVSYRGQVAWRKSRWHHTVGVRHDARSGRTRYCWSRASYVTRRPHSRSPDPAAWCLDLDALQASYTVERRGRASFLGRPALVLRLVPRYEGRPSVQLTLDVATRLPLEVATYRPDGGLYRVVAFRSVEIGPQEVQPDRRPRRSWNWFGQSVPVERLDEQIDFRWLAPEYLPRGFRRIDCRVSGFGLKTLRLIYSDGITTFEIVESLRATPAQMETEYARRFGPRWAAKRMAHYRRSRIAQIVHSEGPSREGGTIVNRRHLMGHRRCDLSVDGIDIQLTCRSDLPSGESLRVLRSLRPR